MESFQAELAESERDEDEHPTIADELSRRHVNCLHSLVCDDLFDMLIYLDIGDLNNI